MSLYTRPNGSNRFATDPRLAPDIGVAIDAEINNIVGIINDLDNANISGSPQIDSSKIDLSVGGFLQDIGDDITGTLNHIFDGVWRRMRASGNARMREYYGSDGALWGIVYNSEWGGTSWNGRDVTGICMAIKIEADGIHFYYAVSAAAGVAPTWTEIFHCNLSGNPLASASADGEITGAKINFAALYIAGDLLRAYADTENSSSNTTYTKKKEIKLDFGGALRIKFDLKHPFGNIAYGKIYRNGAAVGTERSTTSATYVTFSEDISGWSPGDLLQLYVKTNANTVWYQNLRLYSSNIDTLEATLD